MVGAAGSQGFSPPPGRERDRSGVMRTASFLAIGGESCVATVHMVGAGHGSPAAPKAMLVDRTAMVSTSSNRPGPLHTLAGDASEEQRPRPTSNLTATRAPARRRAFLLRRRERAVAGMKPMGFPAMRPTMVVNTDDPLLCGAGTSGCPFDV